MHTLVAPARAPAPATKETPQRRTLLSALQHLLDHSWLKECVEGRRPDHFWPAAAGHDIHEVRNLAHAFVRDMNRFLHSRCRRVKLKEEFNFHIDWSQTSGDYSRCCAFWEAFQKEAVAYIDKIAKGLQAKPQYYSLINSAMTEAPFPACWIIKQGDYAEFIWADSPDKCTRRKLIQVAYVDPDDFPRHMPPMALEMLEIAKTTELDHKPAVLDGVMIEESDVPVLRPKDPGIVLRTGHDLLIHYWKEPASAQDKLALANNPWSAWNNGLGNITLGLLFLVLLMTVGLVLGPGTGFAEWYYAVPAVGCYIVAALCLIATVCNLWTLGWKHRTQEI